MPPTSDKPYRLRIPPSSPRLTHDVGGRLFDRSKGWYPIDGDEKDRFEKVRLYDTNHESPPLFQIVSADVAATIDRDENKARRGTARNPINPATGQPYDDDAIAAELAAERARGDTLQSQVQQLSAGLAVIAKMLPPEARAALGKAMGVPAEEDAAPDSEPPPERPARPGSRAAQEKAERGEKPKRDPKASTSAAASSVAEPPPAPVHGVAGSHGDPLGAAAAVESHDADLKAGGVTTGR